MATWRDGPEYAPGARPEAFIAPQAPPLPDPVPVAQSAPQFPAEEPHFVPASSPQPMLAALVPARAPGRNPSVPFEVSVAAITAGSTSRSPTEPFPTSGPPLTGHIPIHPAVQPNAQVNPAPFPAPNTAGWFAPPPQSRVPAAPPSVTIAQIWKAATPGVIIPLILGAFFSWLSILMLAVSFALSARIPYRTEAIRRSYGIALILLGMIGALVILADGAEADLLFSALSTGAQISCIVLPFVVGLIVGAALRAGERPNRG